MISNSKEYMLWGWIYAVAVDRFMSIPNIPLELSSAVWQNLTVLLYNLCRFCKKISSLWPSLNGVRCPYKTPFSPRGPFVLRTANPIETCGTLEEAQQNPVLASGA